MKRYPEEETWREIAYLAYHTGWQMDQLLDLQHRDRVRMVRYVADVDQRARDLTRESLNA
jgi:hypothetical protein